MEVTMQKQYEVTVVVKGARRGSDAYWAVQCAFAARNPDGCSFHTRKAVKRRYVKSHNGPPVKGLTGIPVDPTA